MLCIPSLGAKNKNTNEYIHPRIANKIDKYICVECDKDLILCKGKIRNPYFRHKNESTDPCHYYSSPTETQIHKEAKMLLKYLLDNKIPLSFIRNCECCKKEEIIKIPEITDKSSIKIEHRFEYNGLKIADVVYIDDENIKYIFEICNTNKTKNENRPEPWFEIDAMTLINIVNNNENLNSIVIPCIRIKRCENCELENLKVVDIEKYIRIKLGQTVFDIKYSDECTCRIICDNCRLRQKPSFYFDDDDNIIDDFNKEYSYVCTCRINENKCNYYYCARPDHLRFWFDARKDTEHNKKIIDLFSDFQKNYKSIVYSYKGSFYAYIIDSNDYDINVYSHYKDYPLSNNYPCVKEMDLTGEGTVQIIKIILETIKNLEKDKIIIEKLNNAYYKTSDIKNNYIYFKINFSKKDLIKNLGGKWNNEHKLWYIKKSIYIDNKDYIDSFIERKIEWVECCMCSISRVFDSYDYVCLKCTDKLVNDDDLKNPFYGCYMSKK